MKRNRKDAKPWSKILYEDSGYPDNYIHEATFLNRKLINANARTYSYWSTVVYSGIIIQQLSSVILFTMIYIYLKYDVINVDRLLIVYFIPLILIAYILKCINEKQLEFDNVKNDSINVLKFVSFVYGLCPILNSLTLTISSDTIYALSAFMLFINIIFHDYGVSNVAIVSKTLSFNAALFSAVCLASRFNKSNNTQYTFTLITISFILFILWPNYRKYLQEKFKSSLLVLTVISFTSSLFALVSMQFWSYAFIYVALFLTITFVCPYCLIKLQPYKSTINGPWDEASIKI